MNIAAGNAALEESWLDDNSQSGASIMAPKRNSWTKVQSNQEMPLEGYSLIQTSSWRKSPELAWSLLRLL